MFQISDFSYLFAWSIWGIMKVIIYIIYILYILLYNYIIYYYLTTTSLLPILKLKSEIWNRYTGWTDPRHGVRTLSIIWCKGKRNLGHGSRLTVVTFKMLFFRKYLVVTRFFCTFAMANERSGKQPLTTEELRSKI